MKRSKKMGVLAAVLVAACAATAGVMLVEEKQEAIKNTDEQILQIPADSVQTLSWEYEDEALAFHKDEIWMYDEDDAFPVDEAAIGKLLDVFEEFGASFVIEDVEDFSQYGLDDPVCTIRLTTEENREAEGTDTAYEIKLGNFSNMDSKRYASIGDGKVYLMSEDPFEQYETTLDKLIQHDHVLVFDEVADVTIDGEEEYTVLHEEESRTYEDADLYYAQIDGKELPLDSDTLEGYLRNFQGLNLEHYATYKVTEEELADYGMDEPELTVTVNGTYENDDKETVSDTFVIHVSRNQKEVEEAEAAVKDEDTEPTGITAYARIGDSPIIYEITEREYDAVMKSAYDDLRHQEMFWADFAKLTQVDITLEDLPYTLNCEKAGFGEEADTWTYEGEELDITAFQTALQALTADSFTDEAPEEVQELALTLHLDNENDPEVSIELYRYDGSSCLAVVDGESVALVPRTQVVDLMEAIHAIVLN